MLLGRPINLWLGLVASAIAFSQVVIVAVFPDVDPTTVATVLGSLGGLLAVTIALVANQPPTVTQGDTVNVVTPEGEPNRIVTVH